MFYLALCLLLSQVISTFMLMTHVIIATKSSSVSFPVVIYNNTNNTPIVLSVKGHTLDLLITRDVDPPVICDINITAGISDHSAILGKINMQRTPVQEKVIRSRIIAAIKQPLLYDNLVDVEVINPDCLNNSLFAHEEHAPMQERCAKLRPHYPHFNENIMTEKRIRRKLENK